MALSATLAELETWIRQDADMQAPDDRVTSEECRNRINRSLAQLYDRLVLVDQEYFLKSATVSSNGSGVYDIMNDFATGVVRSASSIAATGSGYSNGQQVTLVQGSNASATGTVTTSAGNVTGLTITNAGSGYIDATYSQPAFSFLGAAIGGGNTIYGPAIIAGSRTFCISQTSSFGLVEIDGATQSIVATYTASPGGNVTYRSAYVPSEDAIFVARSTGDLWKFSLATNTWSTAFGIAPSFSSLCIVYDDATGLLYATDQGAPSTLYAIDPATMTVSATSLLAFTARVRGGRSQYVYVEDAPTTTLYEIDTTAFGVTAVMPIASSPADFVYVASANKFYINMLPADPVKAWAYDVATATPIDLTATINALPNYVYEQSFLGYDSSQNGVYFSAFVTSKYVAKVDVASDVASEVFEVSFGAGAIGTYLCSTGEIVAVTYSALAPYSTAFEFYSSQSVTVSTPNYIIVNLVPASGFGSGAQALVYIESDFYKCKGVWFSTNGSEPDNGDWSPLRRFNWEQQNALNQSAIYDGLRSLPLYRIVTQGTRDKVLISPDQLSGSYKLWYYPAPPRMLTDTDRFDGRAGWDEWIVKDVAIQLLMAEESIEQAASLKNVRDEIWQRLQLHAEDREAAQPQRIMDATLLSRRYGPRWGR